MQVVEDPQEIDGPEKAKQSLILELSELAPEKVVNVLDIISKMVRAFSGKEVEPDNAITKLIDVKNILERSNFPTSQEINFQVYCRLLAKFHPELECFEIWADTRAHALKSLKALSSEHYVEMFKAQNTQGPPPSATSVNIGSNRQDTPVKRGFFRRNKEVKQNE